MSEYFTQKTDFDPKRARIERKSQLTNLEHFFRPNVDDIRRRRHGGESPGSSQDNQLF